MTARRGLEVSGRRRSLGPNSVWSLGWRSPFRAGKGSEEDGAAAPIHGEFAIEHFNGDPALEEKIKQDLAVTVRCITLDGQGLCDDEGTPGTCPFTGEPSACRVVWAKSY